MIQTLVFGVLVVLVATLLAVAFVPDDIAQLRDWWAQRREELQRPKWGPSDLPRLTRELAGEREWARRYWTPRQRYAANRRMRAAGFGPTLSGRAERLP